MGGRKKRRGPSKSVAKLKKSDLDSSAKSDSNNPPNDATLEILESVPAELREQVLISLVKSEMHSGPLPAADELQKYETALTGLADRIVVMAETEQTHRHNFDNKAIIAYERRGNYSLTLGLSLIAASVYALYLGFPITAIPLGIFGVVGTIVNTIYKHLSQDK